MISKNQLRHAVFLDRDGVINRAKVHNGKPYPPANFNALEILPGVRDALKLLHKLGYLLIVVSNQPDVARGKSAQQDIDLINQKLMLELPLDDIRVCYHDDVDNCVCRKPKPGLIEQAAHDFSIDLIHSFMIGDRWKDIEAGKTASCRTIWIKNDYTEKHPETMDYSADNLLNAAKWIVDVDNNLLNLK